MTKNEDNLLILLVSDTHESIENVNKLVNYCKEKSIKPDYIFCLGDIMSTGKQDDQSVYDLKVEELKTILTTLELISPNLIYIPGNHDFINLFKVEESPKLTENSINLHLSEHLIKDDLLLVGIGGSICSLFSDEEFYHAYKKLDKSKIEWKGYPYIDNKNSPDYEKSDEMFRKDLEKIDSYVNNHKGSVILLTHVGPFTSNTANQYEKRIIYSGSPALNEFLIKYENKILVNVHGHTHDAQGMGKVHTVKVCNPGALLYMRFGLLNLVKNAENDYKWKVEKYEQINLIE
jgi:Icc-related predicted phosphoesterase